jgi:diguanylate cyclase (GGDEF)-like protein
MTASVRRQVGHPAHPRKRLVVKTLVALERPTSFTAALLRTEEAVIRTHSPLTARLPGTVRTVTNVAGRFVARRAGLAHTPPWQRRVAALLHPVSLVAIITGSFLAARGHLLPAAALLAGGAAILWRAHVVGRAAAGAATRAHRLSGLHLATIEALALAIDAKDRTSGSHIRRVQTFARALAHAVGVSDDEVQGIATAALLHDVGKLAVPEHILSKPGPLTEEEFERIKIHPQVGFEIIEHVPFPYPVAPLVLCHHERWDGKGYPLGLRGEDIPLGARILAVSDYFDSITRDRPYNKRMSGDLATLLLRQESGRALDPSLVSVFLELLPTLQFADSSLAAGHESREVLRSRRVLEHGEHAAFENIAKAHQEIYALYEIAQAIGSSLGVADTMSLVAGKLTALVPFSCCALFVNDENGGGIRCGFAAGVDADEFKKIALDSGEGLAGWVIRNRRIILNGRPNADFEAAGLSARTAGLHSALVCPLVSNERVVGALALYHGDADFYSDDHRRLLERISGQAAAAIANSIVFEQTREASLSDPLTGLPNTRYMLAHLSRELARAERQGDEVGILVLDLDDFKQINDTYGHHVGDLALREVARVLRDTIRPYDVCVRYAGDEFIIVLSNCGFAEASAKSTELQNAVANMAFEAAPGQEAPVSLSIGAAVFPGDGETYEALLATADGRMYRDKKARKLPGHCAGSVTACERAVLEGTGDARDLALSLPASTRVN